MESDVHTEHVVGFGVKVNCRKAAREDALGYPDEPCDDTQMMRLILKTTLVCHPERSRRILKIPSFPYGTDKFVGNGS